MSLDRKEMRTGWTETEKKYTVSDGCGKVEVNEMEQRAEKKIYMEKLGKRAVSAKETVAFLNAIQRQEGLILAADALVAQQAYIIERKPKGYYACKKK